jgi:PAS domain S-box-containing protein
MKPQNRIVKILIVDDDEDDFFLTSDYIKHIPKSSYQIDWCPKYKDALKHMLNADYDLYFVDYLLGAKSGVDLLKEALANNCAEPIVLLTGKGNYEVDIEAMQLGAVDYLVKGELTVEKMERCVRYSLEHAATLKALKENERKFRSIFEKSKDIVFLSDRDLNIKEVNDTVFSLLGYTREEALQMNVCDFVEQAQHKKFLTQLLHTRKVIDDWEITFTAKDGDKKYCMLTATLEDGYSGADYVQGIIHDITNLKKAEKATLLSEKLAVAGRLVRTLAHEVRNPLNNITLSVEQMQQEQQDDNSLLYLDIIYRNSRRISDLIGELLNSSKPTEIVMLPMPLQHILDNVINASIDRLTLKHIKLGVNYPDEPLYVEADGEKLMLALLNIVINAVEAMEEGKGTLDISVAEEDGLVVLRISDNGCGISEENVSRLFEPYFTQKRNGVGLGLAFTLNIVQAHNGHIEVTSQPEVGTMFTITFPVSVLTTAPSM